MRLLVTAIATETLRARMGCRHIATIMATLHIAMVRRRTLMVMVTLRIVTVLHLTRMAMATPHTVMVRRHTPTTMEIQHFLMARHVIQIATETLLVIDIGWLNADALRQHRSALGQKRLSCSRRFPDCSV